MTSRSLAVHRRPPKAATSGSLRQLPGRLLALLSAMLSELLTRLPVAPGQ
jgi:hypothetical protein